MSAVLVVIKLLSREDIVFIKSSVDEETRSKLQDLLSIHNNYNRFHGKI